MNRYLKVLKRFWMAAIAAELEYRTNFVLALISSTANFLGSLFGLFLFYRTGYTFPGWSWEEAIVVLGLFTILLGFAATFLSPNLNRIVRHVQEGTLDFILLKPISSQFWLSARTLSPWGFPDIIVGTAMVLYAGTRLGLAWQNYLFGIVPVLCGLASLYSIWFVLGATSVWFVKIYNVTEVLRALLEAGRYPIIAYPAAYRVFFTFVFPIAFLTTIPAETILGRADISWIAGAIVLPVALLFASHVFWKFALRFYTSASS